MSRESQNHYYLVKKLKSPFHWLNRHEANLDDCRAICRCFKITVKFIPLEARGAVGKIIFRNKKKYYVILDEKLKGVEILQPLKQNKEVDAFMRLAMLPKKRFQELRGTPFDELDAFSIETLEMRERLFEK